MTTRLQTQMTTNLIHDFFVRATEAQENFEQDLIRLEALASPDSEVLKRLFKTLTPLKQEAEALAFTGLVQPLTDTETLLDNLTSGALEVSTTTMNNLFQASDQFKDLLKNYQASDQSEAAPAPRPQPQPVVLKPVAEIKVKVQPQPKAQPQPEVQWVAPQPIKKVAVKAPAVSAPLTAQAFYQDDKLIIQVTGGVVPNAVPQAVEVATPPASSSATQALLVEAAGTCFSIPVNTVLEVQRLPQGAQAVSGATITWQGQPQPLHDAARFTSNATHLSGPYMVILQDAGLTWALAVDHLLQPEEVTLDDANHAITKSGRKTLWLNPAEAFARHGH